MKQADPSVSSPGPAFGFTSLKVTAARIDDPSVYAVVVGSQCWCMQSDDEPTMIVVGPGASDDKLQRMAERFAYPLQKLVELRAAQAVAGAA
ncbi:hypothetical protein [Nevskia sp.]|uniref:hypothetical protein n=1 Tax=Nevskia sp. TaxID=1929292 RepID=UPI003F6EA221